MYLTNMLYITSYNVWLLVYLNSLGYKTNQGLDHFL